MNLQGRGGAAQAQAIRDRMAADRVHRKNAIARATPVKTEPGTSAYDDGLSLDEITGRFEAVVTKAIRESQHDGDDRAVLKNPSTPPILRRAERISGSVAKIVGSVAAAAVGVLALLHALGWV